MRDPLRAKLGAAALVAAAFSGGLVLASALPSANRSQATLLQATRPPAARDVRVVQDLNDAFISIAESVTPAVVSISTRRTVRTGARSLPIPEEFRRFFDFDLPDQIPQVGSGSGFLISPDGYILTNNHVVEGAQEIDVTLRDRRTFRARVVGREPTADIAVIKIDGRNLPTVRLGSSTSTRVGEWVLAIGNPLGTLDFTVTAGIVSAKGRPLGIIRQNLPRGQELAIEDFIQTDAVINPGNSGGPLVNLRGEVIGVNSAIASRTGLFMGYGFAIPIDLARRIADDLIRYGRWRRPILGVNITTVTPEDAEVFRLPRVAGAVVQGFSGNSPAQRAGLRQGDVIVGVDGQPVETSNELQRLIALRQPGETVTVEYIRYGERRTARVPLGEAPTTPARPTTPTEAPGERRLGLQLAPLTPELARRFGFPNAGGVVVVGVEPYSPADQRGVAEGDRIVAIDQRPVRELGDVQAALRRKRPGEVVSLQLETVQSGRIVSRIVNLRMPD